jgi:hypothetical protein
MTDYIVRMSVHLRAEDVADRDAAIEQVDTQLRSMDTADILALADFDVQTDA